MSKVVGSIEARMGSSRLPGKTLMNVFGAMSLLECVVKRLELAKEVDEIVVATTIDKTDDPIYDWCKKNRINVHRGSVNDVLGRVVEATRNFNAEVIVQMGADSAYLDYHLIDELVAQQRETNADYVANDMVLTYPLGIYGHVVKYSVLDEINKEKLTNQEREDVVRYIWEKGNRFKIINVVAQKRQRVPELRLTVDYLEDLNQARAVYESLGTYRFTTDDLIDMSIANPLMFAETKKLVQVSAPFVK